MKCQTEGLRDSPRAGRARWDTSSFPSQGEAWVSPATAAASPAGPCAPGLHPSGSLSALAPVTAWTRPGPWGPSSCPCSPGKGEAGSGPACTRAGEGEGAGLAQLWAPGQAPGPALPLCGRLVRSPPALAPEEPLRREV